MKSREIVEQVMAQSIKALNLLDEGPINSEVCRRFADTSLHIFLCREILTCPSYWSSSKLLNETSKITEVTRNMLNTAYAQEEWRDFDVVPILIGVAYCLDLITDHSYNAVAWSYNDVMDAYENGFHIGLITLLSTVQESSL